MQDITFDILDVQMRESLADMLGIVEQVIDKTKKEPKIGEKYEWKAR